MKYQINQEKCTFCGGCSSVCPTMAIEVKDSSCKILEEKCVKCSLCYKFCPIGAVEQLLPVEQLLFVEKNA